MCVMSMTNEYEGTDPADIVQKNEIQNMYKCSGGRDRVRFEWVMVKLTWSQDLEWLGE
jgi:hypothetical protein